MERNTAHQRSPDSPEGSPPGVGWSYVHHGELLQGMFQDPSSGVVRRGLVTLPCNLFRATATFTPGPGPSVAVNPGWRVKARQAALETLSTLELSSSGGWLEVASDVPVARGFGSSTSDVLATIRAVQGAFGCRLPDHEVARIAVRAEGACDSLMFDDQVVLFAQRDAVVLERLGRRIPRLAVLGFGTSPDGRGVDTLARPPAVYQAWEIREFDRLRMMLRTAVRDNDVALVGQVASRSAALNQRHLQIAAFETLADLARRSDAAGLQVAHSGDIAGLLFDASDPGSAERQGLARKLLKEIGISRTWSFATGEESPQERPEQGQAADTRPAGGVR